MTSYQHRVHPRAKRISIRLSSSGEVVVTSPRLTPKFLINRFVKQQEGWIAAQRKKMQSAKTFENNKHVDIFGITYQKQVLYDSENKPGITVQKKSSAPKLVFNPTEPPKTGDWTTAAQKKLDRFLKTTASQYILPRTHELAKKMKITTHKITLRQQKTRWGSCSSKGNLNFNWRLVHFSPAIIDYVIIHELAHRVHLNHSKDFWQLVEKFDPAYRIHRGTLKRARLTID